MRLMPLTCSSIPVLYSTDRSNAVVPLWILFVIYVLCVSLFCCLVCSLGKGFSLGSFVCDVFLCFCHIPIWCHRVQLRFDLLSESYQLTSTIRLAPVLKTFFINVS